MYLRRTLLSFFVVISVVFITGGALSLWSIHHRLGRWQSFMTTVAARETLLSSLAASSGYGGGIHAFKNLVLRRDVAYAPVAAEGLSQAIRATQRYVDIPVVQPKEREAILALRATLQQYYDNVAVAKRMTVDGATSAQIDAVVRVDDTAAVHALEQLRNHLEQLRVDALEDLERDFGSTRSILLGFYLTTFVIGLAYMLGIGRRIAQRIGLLIDAARRIAQGDLVSPVMQDSVGEVAALAGNMESMRSNLKQTMDALNESNAELERFAYIASHDLKEPVRRIGLQVDLLARRLESGDATGVDKSLAGLRSSADTLRRLIDDILKYSRMSRETNVELVDLNQTLAEVRDLLHASIAEASAEVDVEPLPTVRASAVGLRQVFVNLLGNALKFRKSDEALSVRVWAETADGACTVFVRDNGIGFDPALEEKLFAPFQRLHSGYPGSGLGLALCRRIIEQQGGTIQATSTPGAGATFRVTMPLAVDAE